MPLPSKSKISDRAPITVSFSDSISLIRDQVHWTPKGVRLLTKWHFAEGTEVEFAFDHRGERHCCSGIVVGCHPLRQPAGFFETILFFIETPCTRLQKAACDCRLAHDGHRDETHFTMTTPSYDGATARPGRSRSAAAARNGGTA
jgi:hypothetical protein